MKRRHSANFKRLIPLCSGLLFFMSTSLLVGEPTAAAVSVFDSYSRTVELRLVQQHRAPNTFLASSASSSGDVEMRLRGGELILENLTPPPAPGFSGALLHHWRGTAFAPGARAADFERLMRDFSSYPHHFSPEVIQAKALAQTADHMQAWMRIRQKHVITVVMDTTYDITFGRQDGQHGYSISRSTRIAEIEAAGTASERTLSADEDHGFLWRMNTYWSYAEQDGGLYLQIEVISLSRSIPNGVGWAVQPYVESIPRESLGFTLRSTCNALRR